jgi:amino acid transporter
MIPASVTGSATTPKFLPSSQVWSIQNGTDWPDGVAVLMSFIAIIWTMSGYDAPFHLSEECSNANVAAPRAIVMTSGIGGLMGWALQLVVAYTVIDIDEVISSDLGQPWASYLVQVMPQKIALAVLSLTIICGFFMGQGCMVAASRVTFAYARDDCFPASFWIKNLHTRQRRVVQHDRGNPPSAPHFRRLRLHWSNFLRRCHRRLRRLHHPNLHPRLLRRRPLPPRTMALGQIQ